MNAVPRTKAEQARIEAILAPPTDFTKPEAFETRPGGGATWMGARSGKAFSHPAETLPEAQEMDFLLGRSLFKKLWVTAPSATVSSDGIGPLFNARSCLSCHVGNGRGHPPEHAQDTGVSMALHISIPKSASKLSDEVLTYLNTAPEPTYGTQLQDKSNAGHAIEARVQINYRPQPVALADGETITLRVPDYQLTNLGYGPLHPQAMISPRVAPPMIGLGLLETIPEADILAHADPDDADGDGISGRANKVWSAEYDQWMLGRFGLKAGQPTVRGQSMAAFSADMGLSNPLRPAHAGDCTAAQADCLAAPHGGTPAQDDLEVGHTAMDLVTLYSRTLAVPARAGADDPQVLQGKALFHTAQCASCHVPKYVTHRLSDRPEDSFQLIWPYTDLLLHDMGDGLADNRPEGQATGREWRTPPLWGIGATRAVGGQETYLHDGRARSLLEAVLWHGGEAEAARNAVRAMTATERAALIAFLESL